MTDRTELIDRAADAVRGVLAEHGVRATLSYNGRTVDSGPESGEVRSGEGPGREDEATSGL